MNRVGNGQGLWRTVCALAAVGVLALALSAARQTTASQPRERDARQAPDQLAARPSAVPEGAATITLHRLNGGDDSAARAKATDRSGRIVKPTNSRPATEVRYTFGGPANDLCEDASAITDGLTPFSTVGSATDGKQYICVENWACEDNGSGLQDVPNDIWFEYIASCTGTLKLTTCEQEGGFSDYDSKIAIEDGAACQLVPFGPAGTCLTPGSGCSFLGCGDDDGANACGQGEPWSSTVEVLVTIGQDVRIRVGGFDAGQFGTGDLRVSCIGVSVCGDGFCAANEICTCNGAGQDCDGQDPVPEVADQNCQDGLDNDCNEGIDCADPDCAADTVCSCAVTCAVAAGTCNALEDDLCLVNYVDNCNAGCSRIPGTIPIPYGTMDDGDIACGTSGRYDLTCVDDEDCYANDFCYGICAGGLNGGAQCDPDNGGDPDADCLPGGTCGTRICRDTADIPGSRDRDYRQFELTATSTVTYCILEHEFVALMGISQDEGGVLCDEVGVDPAESPSICEDPTCVTATLPAGLYSAYIAPDINSGPVPCGANYRISLEIEPAPPSGTICTVSTDDLHCQPPDQEGHAGFVGQFSDVAAGQKAADNFRVDSGTSINEICWWGYYGTLTPVADGCVGTHTFEVTYYNDNDDGLRPGTVLAGPFTVSPTLLATNQVIPSAGGDFPEYSFTATHASVTVMAGKCYWVSVQANTSSLSDNCEWLWTTSGPDEGLGFGDALSALDSQDCGTFDSVNDHSHTWCLSNPSDNVFVEPGGCNPSGACCADAGGTCTNNANFAGCAGRFHIGSCAALSPPCGGGACCADDGSCTNTADNGCPTGTFNDGLSCDVAACNPADEGCFENGEPDLCSSTVGSLSQLTDDVIHVESADDFILAGTGPFTIDKVKAWFVVENGTPADWDSVLLTIYEDNESDGTTDTFTADCGAAPLPDGPGTVPVACDTVADCPVGAECIDADNDCFDECSAVCTINVTGHPEPIIDLDVQTVIAHTWQGDVSVALEHVGSGPKVNLIRRPGQAIHGACGGGGDGYSQDNYGDPGDDDPLLTLSDEAEIAINVYCENLAVCPGGLGTLNYAGPARPGGCVEPSGQLAGFRGQAKNGMWKLYASDGYGELDFGTLERFTLLFNNFLGPGPTGKPEYSTVACPGGNPDCIAAGGTTCTAGVCDNLLVPTVGHTGVVEVEIELLPLSLTSVVYPGVPNAWAVTMDLPGAGIMLSGDTKYWIAITPRVPAPGPGAAIASYWMVSDKKADSRAQQIATATAEWASIGDRDLAFQMGGSTSSCTAPCAGVADCADLDNDNKRDDPCLWYACNAGVCSSLPRGTGNGGQYGQADTGRPAGVNLCQVDGVADGNDKFHALNCFSNTNFGGPGPYPCEPSSPQALNVDAGQAANCTLDGVCDGNDSFHALNSFGNSFFGQPGGYQCTCTGPAPAAPPVEPDDFTGLALRAPEFVEPGGLVDVDVYLTGDVKTMAGYQLHLGVTGGKTGSLELVDMTVDASRETYVYDDQAATWTAFSRQRDQLVVGMDAIAGLPAQAGAYLATFTYRVPKDAAGTFAVEVLHDAARVSLEHRTFLFGYYGRPVGLTSVTPASITVKQPRERDQRLGMR